MPVMGGPEGAHGSDLRERNADFALTTNGWWSVGPLSFCAVLVGPSGAFHRLGVGYAPGRVPLVWGPARCRPFDWIVSR